MARPKMTAPAKTATTPPGTNAEIKLAGQDAMANALGEQASRGAKERPAWQEGKRAVTVWVDEEQYRRVNSLHYEVRKPVRELFQEALDLMLLAYEQEPVFKAEAMKMVAKLEQE